MRVILCVFGAALLCFGCKSVKNSTYALSEGNFVIAFGSCNKQGEQNLLWDDVLANKPAVWIWGGDNIYSDTDNVREMRKDYEEQRYQDGYKEIKKHMDIIGTWDDHDYGVNDGGADWKMKKEAQELFLNFMDVPKHDPRRSQEGVYNAKTYHTTAGDVKVIVLDTRYFRSPLTKNLGDDGKRFMPNPKGVGTILGEKQWAWLANELNGSTATFNIIVSSIQVLSNKHGFETWGNFPGEVEKLFTLIKSSGAQRVIMLSGDRHISEFSQINISDLSYPLIDFTSSGLTHTYEAYSGEENPYRVGEVVIQKSFGLLKLNMKNHRVTMEMIGNGNRVLNELEQGY
ncbi:MULTISPECIES: alkaline phosphatase D family protein [Galbibacter]|uniref:Alkaline phosphatase D family protein n=1 Tax=Galbibacter pacificus TaxID=2996052 RepID=A0ABT6FP27_9FLAO|nr:alkaline phosphatase D family protein [Galbibacter pacificus]MDG3581336.1 alkaline phosphatase D family protein [Galbibacter pacificus]MDG3584814.1 alkaline phosphatase D family protein [Galbibacter pacificus]